jgi:hypothetical protein
MALPWELTVGARCLWNHQHGEALPMGEMNGNGAIEKLSHSSAESWAPGTYDDHRCTNLLRGIRERLRWIASQLGGRPIHPCSVENRLQGRC